MQIAPLYNPEHLKHLDNEVHVWFAEPDAITDADQLTYFQSILASDEKARHDRFHFEKDRKHYLVAHALVRLALSNYAGNNPADWKFSANAHGRPEIESPDTMRGLRFNLTHTNGLCACVVTLERDCGIDAEALANRHNLKKIADRMFAGPELEEISELAEGDRGERFFRHWTLREACCKALGVGLAGSTKDFYFNVMDEKRPRVIFTPGSGQADQWQFALVRITDSHLVAIAVHRPDRPDLKIVIRTIKA